MLTTDELLKQATDPFQPSLFPRNRSRDIPIYLPLEKEPASPAKRKRGAQPGNQNARKCKAREASLPTTIAPEAIAGGVAYPAARAAGQPFSQSLVMEPSANFAPTFIDFDRQRRRNSRCDLARDIREFTELSLRLGQHFDQALITGQRKATRLAFKCLLTCANAIDKFAALSIRLTWQERVLTRCADHAHLSRVHKDPNVHIFKYSFLEDPHTLSTYSGQSASPVSFLTDRHWLLIAPLITAQLAADKEAALQKRDPTKKQRASRAVPWPERFLLDGILWKLATACTWSELPQPYPLRRCQDLYRSLARSGRLGHILTILHEDLNEYSNLGLKQMALNGEYLVWGSKILYIPHGEHNWQGLVTLLLLQLSHRILLHERRNHPPSLGSQVAHCLPDLPSLYRSTSDMQSLKRLINPRRFIPAGTLRIPPPINHPSLNSLPPFSDHILKMGGSRGVHISRVELHTSPPDAASAKSTRSEHAGKISSQFFGPLHHCNNLVHNSPGIARKPRSKVK